LGNLHRCGPKVETQAESWGNRTDSWKVINGVSDRFNGRFHGGEILEANNFLTRQIVNRFNYGDSEFELPYGFAGFNRLT
jgi:hypothetical protein